MRLIYVAGPYSIGDPVINTRAACQAADELLNAGFAPLVPHLSMLWHTISPKTWEEWMEIDLQYVLRSDGVLRIPGESTGADREVAFANGHYIPVFHSILDVGVYFGHV